MKLKRTLLILTLLLASFAIFVGLLSTSVHPAEAQVMPPTPAVDRLAPWPTVYPPTQADSGAQVYWGRCMMCHGDKGQGLNQDWLSVMDVPDQNCWKSGCHGPHHGANGFTFPKVVPAVIGPGVLNNFSTGLDLYNFIKLYMPYQDRGGLSSETYWDLTAYLLRQNGYYDGKQTLDAQLAKSIIIRPSTAAPIPPTGPSWRVWTPYLAAGGVLVIFLAALGIYRFRSRGKLE